jgi:carbon storage regulator CsrA
MLIITLTDGEYITIGDSIKIKVVKTRGTDVRLGGIEAPPDMEILRSKLLEKKQNEKNKV